MNFPEIKNAFFNKKINKKNVLKLIKTSVEDLLALEKMVNRVEKEIIIAKAPLNKIILGENPLPKLYSNLNKGEGNYFSESIKIEMNWHVLAFVKCSKFINLFIDLRQIFEYNLLMGNYKIARETLDRIEVDICVSFWSVENRFILDEFELGAEKNWETRNQVLNDKNEAFLQTLADMYSIRTEKKVPFFQYNEIINNWQETQSFDRFKKGQAYIDYFRFKGNYFSQSTYLNSAYMLYLEEGASIIDRYIMFTRLAQHILAENKDVEFLKNIMTRLQKEIRDISIGQMLLMLNLNNPLDPNYFNVGVVKIIDEYTRGNYRESYSKARDYLISRQFTHQAIFPLQ